MLPQAFLQRMELQLGAECPAFLASLERPRAVALRFNPLKGARPALPFALTQVPWEEMGYYYPPQERPGLHVYHDCGVYYLQEASAMAPVTLLDPQPGEKICDLCAAPGGKSTQIAGRMQGRGLLVSNEIQPKRAKILSRNIERMGVANAIVTNESPEALAGRFPGFFDRVLVDAPCSGEGMFRKEAAAVEDWSPETVAMCARRQREILGWAGALVRPGGLLVYSTCTFSREENEDTVAAFLDAHPEFAPEERDAPWFTPAGEGEFRLWPHKLLGEGHFAAVLRKSQGETGEIAPLRGAALPADWENFARTMGITLPDGKGAAFGQTYFWTPPETPSLTGLRVLRPGLELGEGKPGRFQPAHALALWARDCAHTLDFPPESGQIAAYLHGDVIAAGEKGWVLVQAGGYGLGWGKGDGNQVKNHYPKGLRR